MNLCVGGRIQTEHILVPNLDFFEGSKGINSHTISIAGLPGLMLQLEKSLDGRKNPGENRPP